MKELFVKPFGFDIEPVISLQKLINSSVTKALTSPYVLCKISNFQSIIAQRLSGTFRDDPCIIIGQLMQN